MSELNKGSLSDLNTSNNFNPSNANQIISARVIDIILNDKHPEFNRLGKWDSIGIVFFSEVNKVLSSNIDLKQLPFAKPLNSAVKHFPLKNELIYVLSFPTSDSQNNIHLTEYYYAEIINIWNHPHHNALPHVNNTDGNVDTNYVETSQGNVKIAKNTSSDLNLGNTFKENKNIRPLLPNEGDYIVEGRFGQSLRFGSNEKGNPITIIRNGQFVDTKTEGWIPILEDINKDNTSFYFTEGVAIPIEVASKNLKSFSINISGKNDSQIKSVTSFTSSFSSIESNNLNSFQSGSGSIINSVKNIPTSSIPNPVNEEDDFNTDPNNFKDDGDPIDSNEVSDAYANETSPLESDKRGFSGNAKVYYNISYQSQNDSNDLNIRKFGCAATSCAMLISFVKKRYYSKEEIIRTNKGLSVSFFTLAASLGLVYQELHNYSEAKNILQNKPIILLIDSLSSPGNPTKQHFVVGVGIDSGGEIIIHDPVRRLGPNIILSKSRYHLTNPKNKIRIFS